MLVINFTNHIFNINLLARVALYRGITVSGPVCENLRTKLDLKKCGMEI